MPDDRWRDLIAVARLDRADVTPALLDGRRLAVYDTPDGIHVTSARCSHGGADLCDGYLDGFRIECPLHQGCFDIRTGKATGRPATRPIRAYACRVVDGMVQIDWT